VQSKRRKHGVPDVQWSVVRYLLYDLPKVRFLRKEEVKARGKKIIWQSAE
jgi:hypothetical protein